MEIIFFCNFYTIRQLFANGYYDLERAFNKRFLYVQKPTLKSHYFYCIFFGEIYADFVDKQQKSMLIKQQSMRRPILIEINGVTCVTISR